MQTDAVYPGTMGTRRPCLKMAIVKGHAGAEKARRMVGDYSGAVPECLKLRPVEWAFTIPR